MKKLAKRKELYSYLDELEISGYGVEIGVFKGHNAVDILSHWKGCKKLYMIDVWKDGGFNLHKTKKITRHFKNKEIIHDSSENVVDNFDDGYFSFIYIDASHTYEVVTRDIASWYPKLKSNGIFAGHDYRPDGVYKGAHYGVVSAVQNFSKDNNLKIEIINEGNGSSWWVIKP